MTDVAMSETCICGRPWPDRQLHPAVQLCNCCENDREDDRDLTLAPLRERVVETAKIWLEEKATKTDPSEAERDLAVSIALLKRGEESYVWAPYWKK
jgi:hypothetical protein